MSEEAERLNQALDRLIDGESPEDGADDDPLLQLAAGLHEALAPVPPAGDFRARLKAELLERYADNVRRFPVPAPVALPRPSRWRRLRHAAVAIGAATAASLALVFGYDALHHTPQAPSTSPVAQGWTDTPTATPIAPTASSTPLPSTATPLRGHPGSGANPVQPSSGAQPHHQATPAPTHRPTATATGARQVANTILSPTATDTPVPPDTATTPPDTATPVAATSTQPPASATQPPASATRPAATATTPPAPTRTMPATSTVPAPTSTRPAPTRTPAAQATATAGGQIQAQGSVTVPTDTAVPPTDTPIPPATNTAAPSNTVPVPSATAVPTQPAATRTPAPTSTTPPAPTATRVPPTATSAPPPPSATAAPRKTATAAPSDTPVPVLPAATPTVGAPPVTIVAQATPSEQPRATHATSAGAGQPTATATPTVAVHFPAPLPANAGAGSPLGGAAPYAPSSSLRVAAALPAAPAQLPVFTPASGQGSAADILRSLGLSERVTAQDRGTATALVQLKGHAYQATLVLRSYGYHLTLRLQGTVPAAPAAPPSFDVIGTADGFLDARGLGGGTYAGPAITQEGSLVSVALTQQSGVYALSGAQAVLTFDTNGVLHGADVRWVDTAAAPLVNSISSDAARQEIAAGHGLISPRGATPDAESLVSGVQIIYVPVNAQDGTYYEPVYQFTGTTGAGAQFQIYVPAIGAVYLG